MGTSAGNPLICHYTTALNYVQHVRATAKHAGIDGAGAASARAAREYIDSLITSIDNVLYQKERVCPPARARDLSPSLGPVQRALTALSVLAASHRCFRAGRPVRLPALVVGGSQVPQAGSSQR